jgi:hypothetical protein
VAIALTVHCFVALEAVLLVIFYFVHAFNNDRLSGHQRGLWMVLLPCANVVAMPIYWYRHIWKALPPRDLPTHPAGG